MSELDRARVLKQYVNELIPLTRELAFDVEAFDGKELKLRAPLDRNINDKGTAFAGSLATIAVLSGWYYTTLYVEKHFGKCDAAVVKSETEYKAPVTGDLVTHVQEPSIEEQENFQARMKKKGRARLSLNITVGDGKTTSVVFRGQYHARLTDS